MPKANSIVGKVENGHISMNPVMLARFVERNKGKWVDISAREAKRTVNQNSMYRAWLDNMCDHTGNPSTDDMHEFLLAKLAPKKTTKISGKKGAHEVTRPMRTHEMNKMQMSEFMEKCAVYTDYPLPTQEELAKMGYLQH